jgi:hypothetical protein
MVIFGIVNGGIGFLLGWEGATYRYKVYATVATFVEFLWIVRLVINVRRKGSVVDLLAYTLRRIQWLRHRGLQGRTVLSPPRRVSRLFRRESLKHECYSGVIK